MTDEEHLDIEAGRRLFARSCDFVMGAVNLNQLPPPDRIEIAFAGRSNVGKSSLINALTGQNRLARTSGAPGRTRELNFFDLDGSEMRIVDLPGYGFAKAPKKIVEKWTRLTRGFLRGRVNLKRVYLLIDSRHGVKDVDRAVMKTFNEAAVSYQIVLTKIDKLKKGEAEKAALDALEAVKKYPAAFPRAILSSSSKKMGMDELRAEIAALAPKPPA